MAYVAGQVLTAAELNSWLPVLALKTAATSRTSAPTPTADPDLSVTLLAGCRYRVEVNLGVDGPTAADIQINYALTGTVTQSGAATGRELVGPPTSVSSSTDTTMRNQKSGTSQPTTAVTYGTLTTATVIREVFFVDGGASGGTLTLLWSQGTTNVSATSLTGAIVAQRVA